MTSQSPERVSRPGNGGAGVGEGRLGGGWRDAVKVEGSATEKQKRKGVIS